MSNGFIPQTLEEALEIMTANKVIPIAGGTDLMVKYRREGGISPQFENPLLFLNKIDPLKRIEINSKQLIIGSGVLLRDLIEDKRIPDVLSDTARQMAAVTTRNVATIGGNISNASPAADTLPFLYAADASIILQSADNVREMPIDNFVTGPGQTCRKSDELLVEIRIPLENFDVEYYRKVGTRKAMALSKIAFAGMASFTDGNLSDIRICLGAVAPTIVRRKELENRLKGLSKKEIEEILPEIRMGYEKYIQPINDARSSKEYRKTVSLDMIQAFIEEKIIEGGQLK